MMHYKTILAAATVLIIIASSLTVPVSRSVGVPHAILGFVRDLNGNPVLGVRVFLNVTRSDVNGTWVESMNQTTDILGRYSIGIEGFSSGYAAGDVFNGTAVYYSYNATGSITIDSEPIQQLDFILNFRHHRIEGYVKKPDGSAAIHFGVKVTNLDRNESRNCTTAIDGLYRMDIALYDNGYAVNDDISVSVIFSGFYGINYSIVSANLTDIINITLTDIEKPVLTLWEAPTAIELGESYRILAQATDNMGVTNVSLYMKSPGQTLFTKYEMFRDDGNLHDWDGNNYQSILLWGLSTADSLPVQTNIGLVRYYFEATDSVFLVTLPSVNPQDNAFVIEVLDVTPPTLTHTPITQMESAQPTEITAMANDNIAISQVRLFYRRSTAPTFTEIQMQPTGNPKEYVATIPPQIYLGTLEYYVWCNDTSNNNASSPPTGHYSVNVIDTTAPVITHTYLNSAHVFDSIYFTCEVLDAWLNDVWINYTEVDGTPLNVTMLAGSGSEYHYTASGQNTPGILYYTIWANDTTGNIARKSHAMAITDIFTPLIYHTPPEYLEYNVSEELLAYIVDDVNVPVNQVNLSYKLVGDTLFTLVTMSTTDSDGKHGNFTGTIPPQAIGTLEYFINATDDSSNYIHWPAIFSSYSIEVLDIVSPTLSNLTFTDFCPANIPISIKVNATDNDQVSVVSLMWLNSTGTVWSQLAMVQAGSGVYEVQFPAHKPDIVKFYVSAIDPSSNNATLPAVQPKLNPFLIEFYNTTIPEIYVDASLSMGVNRSAEIYIQVIDNREGAEVELSFKGTEDAAYTDIRLAVLQNGTFQGTIPAQNRSGTAQYYVICREGTTIYNQTQVCNITVVNTLPVIYHVAVPSAPVGENVALVAMVTDDLHVENVTLSWKLDGTTQYTVVPMLKDTSGIYSANLSQDEPVIIQYYITACDAEGFSRFPELLEWEITITDLEAPEIVHSPITNLTTREQPIIIATVTDNRQVENVHLFYRNSTATTFTGVQMMQASGSDDYAALLGRQPEGNFSYYFEASDGINTARSPTSGTYQIAVEKTSGSGWIPSVLFVTVIILISVALLLVLMRFRRKPIKEEAVSPGKQVDSDENAG